MLGDKIRQHRKRNHLSQEELAEKLGVSRQSISLWENNQTQPTIENIVVLAKLFDISTDELLITSGESANSYTTSVITDSPVTNQIHQPVIAPETLMPHQQEETPMEKITANESTLGMAWYKFLIYFALIAGAVINFIYSISYIFGGVYLVETNGKLTAEQVYAYYGAELQVVDVLYGLFLITFGVLAIVLRHKLANYKPDSLKFIKIAYSLSAGVPLLYAILVSIITEQSLPVEAVAFAIFGLLFLLLNVKYFKKREHLFVEKMVISHPISTIKTERESTNQTTSTPDACESKGKVCKAIIIGVVSVVVVILIALIIKCLIVNNNKNTTIESSSTTTTIKNDDSTNNTATYNVGIRTVTFADEFTAEVVLNVWLLGDATETTIIEVMNEYGADQGGGQLRIVERGYFVEEIDAWCFSSKRKAGDYAIIENVYGYTLCYYSGRNLAGNPSTNRADANSGAVWLTDCYFLYYEDYSKYVLLFELNDEKEQAISAAGSVDIRIVNSENITVYSGTKHFTESDFEIWTNDETEEMYFAEICIEPNDIISGSTDTGWVYFTVYGDGYRFEGLSTYASGLHVQ